MDYHQVSEFADYYKVVDHIDTENGYVVWRRGTGDNVELLHLRVTTERRVGYGRSLLCQMLEKLIDNPPYHTVFGFTRLENQIAIEFYQAMGFETTVVNGVYLDGAAVLFSQSFEILLERNHVKKNS